MYTYACQFRRMGSGLLKKSIMQGASKRLKKNQKFAQNLNPIQCTIKTTRLTSIFLKLSDIRDDYLNFLMT